MKASTLVILIAFLCTACFDETDYDVKRADADKYIRITSPMRLTISADGISSETVEATLASTIKEAVMVTFVSSNGNFFSNGNDSIRVKSILQVTNEEILNTAKVQVISKLDTGNTSIRAVVGEFTGKENVAIKFETAPPTDLDVTTSDFFVVEQFEKKIDVFGKLSRTPGFPSNIYSIQFFAEDSLKNPIGSFQQESGKIDAAGTYRTVFGINTLPENGSWIKVIARCIEEPSIEGEIIIFVKPKE